MMFRFAYPLALLLLLLPVILLLALRSKRWGIAIAALRYSDTRLVEGLSKSWRIRLRALPDALRLTAWALLVVALAQPQSGRGQVILRGEGVEIVLALDISGSMGAPDFDPQNRLEAAKTVISRFIAGREFDRIGLVVFAREAFQQAPPTLDYDVLLGLLDRLKLAPDLSLDDGTAIGMGLASAGNMLRASSAPSRVIVLLTDGANNAGAIDPITAAHAVQAFGIRVYTVGMGRADPQTGVASDLDEETLREIAQIGGGVYFRAVDLVDLQRIYDQINVLERSEVERQILVRWQEQGFGLLLGGLILLCAERLLRQTVFQTLP